MSGNAREPMIWESFGHSWDDLVELLEMLAPRAPLSALLDLQLCVQRLTSARAEALLAETDDRLEGEDPPG